MVTRKLVALTMRLVPGPNVSPNTRALIDRYSPRGGEAIRQQLELSLVVANSALLVAVTAAIALFGWLTDAHGGGRSLVVAYDGAVVVALAGIALHLVRYYDALIGKFAKRERCLAWPRRSGDLDLVVQLAAGFVVGIVAAYR